MVQAGDMEEEAKRVENEINETFRNMEKLYELKYNSSPSAQDTITWLLMGALNLAHRVVCLEREAAMQTRDLEEKLSKLLDDVSDYAVPNNSTTDGGRPLPME
jgi:phage host-nuclease inhibitor protein Gam